MLFAHYEIVARLGAGGSAEVFLAQRKGTHDFAKKVALKILRAELSDIPEFRATFTAEAKLVADLAHPHIVQVFELGEHRGRYFIAMEYIGGADAAALLADGGLPLGAVTAMMRDVLAALHYAHEKRSASGAALGIVHRDLSPHNVLLSREGVVKLTDFGTAKVSLGQAKTRTGIWKGKFRYMSPEQAHGKAVDRRSDVFAAALLVSELMRGRPAYDGDGELDVLRQAQNAQVVLSDLPAPIARVLATALCTRPDERFASAHKLDAALTAAAIEAGEPAWSEAQLASWAGARVPESALQTSVDLDLLDAPEPPPPRARATPWRLALPIIAALAASAYALTRNPPQPPPVSVDVATVPPAPLSASLPVAPSFGFLTFNSQPWSRVWLDGKRVAGETPIRQLRLPAGAHTLTLVSVKGQRATLTVDIKKDETTTRFYEWRASAP